MNKPSFENNKEKYTLLNEKNIQSIYIILKPNFAGNIPTLFNAEEIKFLKEKFTLSDDYSQRNNVILTFVK